MSQEGSDSSDSLGRSESSNIVPLSGLEAIFEELLREDGYGSTIILNHEYELRPVSIYNVVVSACSLSLFDNVLVM